VYALFLNIAIANVLGVILHELKGILKGYSETLNGRRTCKGNGQMIKDKMTNNDL
jgi:hypothetical protein